MALSKTQSGVVPHNDAFKILTLFGGVSSLYPPLPHTGSGPPGHLPVPQVQGHTAGVSSEESLTTAAATGTATRGEARET